MFHLPGQSLNLAGLVRETNKDNMLLKYLCILFSIYNLFLGKVQQIKSADNQGEGLAKVEFLFRFLENIETLNTASSSCDL